MKVKKFSTYIAEGGQPSADFVAPKDSDKEVKGYQPRAKGEQDFANQHMVQKTDYYAVPGQDHIFNGDRSQVMEEVEELEEGVLDTLKKIVKDKAAQNVKFSNGKSMKVDMTTANALVRVHASINPTNQKKFEAQLDKGPTSFMKMADFAFSVGK